MSDNMTKEIRKSYGCLVRVGQMFITTTVICLVLTIWNWFDGRFLAFTVLSLLMFCLTWWMLLDTAEDYRKALRREARKR